MGQQNPLIYIVDIRKMKTYQSFSKSYFYGAFAIVVAVWVMAVTIIVLLGAFGFVGFGGSSQITTTCTNHVYYYIKYSSALTNIIETCFVFAIAAVVFATTLLVEFVFLLIKLCKQQPVAFRGIVKLSLYLLSSLLILSAMIPTGYYLSFYREISQCTSSSYSSSQIMAIFIIGLVLVALAVLLWLMLVAYFNERVSSWEKYREVTSNTHQTEVAEEGVIKREEYKVEKQQQQPYTYEKKKQTQNQPVYKLEETNQNIYDSPSRKQINYTYNKQPRSNLEEHKSYNKGENTQPFRVQLSPKNVANLSPLRSYGKADGYSKKREDPNEGELVYAKGKNPSNLTKDEIAYKQAEKQYLSRNNGGRSILPSNGMEERQYKGSEYFKSGGDPPRKYQERSSPPKKPEKEGVLINYIRGKYAG